MEPDELFYVCAYHWFRRLAQLAGLDIFLDNFKVTPPGYILISSLYALFLSCVWTLYAYPFDEKLMCVTFLAFGCEGIVKFHSLLKNQVQLKAVCDFCLKVYRANKRTSPNKAILEKSVNITVLIFKVGILFLSATAILTVLKPLFTYLLIGKVEPIIPTYFPLLNEQETSGYASLAVFHAYLMFAFVIGTAATDFGLMVFVFQSYTMSKIFRNAVNDFNSLVVKNKRDTNNKDMRASLRNLILMHIDFVKLERPGDRFWTVLISSYDFSFTKTIKRAFHEICFIQITMANTIMIVLVYVILVMDWFPAYFFMATAFFQVFEYSVLGTIYEKSNDEVYNSICNISVVDLAIADQRQIIFMIFVAQNPHLLTIGGVEPLNVKTFVEACKRTYSLGMLLVNTQQ